MVKIQYQGEYHNVTIEQEAEPEHIKDFIEDLILPLLRGVGYAEGSIEDYIGTI